MNEFLSELSEIKRRVTWKRGLSSQHEDPKFLRFLLLHTWANLGADLAEVFDLGDEEEERSATVYALHDEVMATLKAGGELREEVVR